MAEDPAAAGDGMAAEDEGEMRPVPTLQELYRTALRRGAPLRVVDLLGGDAARIAERAEWTRTGTAEEDGGEGWPP